MTWIKVCGLTNSEDARLAVEFGADAVGLIFAQSPRQISPDAVEEIIETIPVSIVRVGVFVNELPEFVHAMDMFCQLDVFQFHGAESPKYMAEFAPRGLKAFRIGGPLSLVRIESFLKKAGELDEFGANEKTSSGVGVSLSAGARLAGSKGLQPEVSFLLDSRKPGAVFDWELAREARRLGSFILAGGLNADNIITALEQVQPVGVDVSSGVEARPGKKDPKKLERFIRRIRKWDEKMENSGTSVAGSFRKH